MGRRVFGWMIDGLVSAVLVSLLLSIGYALIVAGHWFYRWMTA